MTPYEKPITNFNRYVYANNNPYKFTDPDGRESACVSMGTMCGQGGGPTPTRDAVASAAVDFVPVVGDVKGIVEAVHNPSAANVTAAVVGLVPVVGDVAGKAIKAAGNAADSVGEGTKVFRAFGENNKPMGQSWTTTDPNTVSNFRDAAGLPDVNTGRFVAEGRITDMTGVTTRDALPLDGNRGGLPEVLIPNAAEQVRLERVSGVNPEY